MALSYLPEEQSDAEDTQTWIEKSGARCFLLPGDITDEATARGVVDTAADLLVDELRAEHRFEFLEAGAQRRLGDETRLRGAGEIAVLGGHQEGMQGGQGR